MNKDIKKDLYELISELQGVKQNMNENDSLKKDLGLDSLMLRLFNLARTPFSSKNHSFIL